MSQVPEDRARRPRCRVITQNFLSRRGRLVSRFGKNHVLLKSTTVVRGRRARPRGPPRGHAQHVGIARHARRHLAGTVRRARRRGDRCRVTNSLPKDRALFAASPARTTGASQASERYDGRGHISVDRRAPVPVAAISRAHPCISPRRLRGNSRL